MGMFSRVTWSQLATPSQADVDKATSFFRDRILPSLKTQAGFFGAVVLANAETGEGVSVTHWQTAEARAASEAMSTAGRVEVAQANRIVIKDIDRFEILLQDRAGPAQAGSFVRVNDVQAPPAQIDAAFGFLRDTALPAIRAQSGYRALLIFANRETGRMLVTSAWDTAAAREASEAAAGGLRRQAADVAQAQPGSIRVSLYQS